MSDNPKLDTNFIPSRISDVKSILIQAWAFSQLYSVQAHSLSSLFNSLFLLSIIAFIQQERNNWFYFIFW